MSLTDADTASAGRKAGAEGAKRRFGLVLSGGGARGLAHAGALRALEHLGYVPGVIVGVSMGAVVGATYALNDAWYGDLIGMDVSGFPVLPDFSQPGLVPTLRALRAAGQVVSSMYFGWGIGAPAVAWGRALLDRLTCGRALDAGRVPVFAVATDLATGRRVVLGSGPATDALYASSAIAGLLPPACIGEHLLIDGGYADMAPVDVARAAGAWPVIAVDASTRDFTDVPRDGLHAMLRAVEICQNEHSRLRFGQADLVLRPKLSPMAGTFDFVDTRRNVAAGAHAVLQSRAALGRLLGGRDDTQDNTCKETRTK